VRCDCSVAQIEGQPTYTDNDYVENDYQARNGNVAVLGRGDARFAARSNKTDIWH
jgi:hypothetical protein